MKSTVKYIRYIDTNQILSTVTKFIDDGLASGKIIRVDHNMAKAYWMKSGVLTKTLRESFQELKDISVHAITKAINSIEGKPYRCTYYASTTIINIKFTKVGE